MRIRHPVSFVLTIVIGTATAGLTVAFNMIHIGGLVVVIGLLWLTRSIAHHEGRHDFGKPAFWRKWV